jgi:hypothetical protein
VSRWLCHLLFPNCRWVWVFNVRNLSDWDGADTSVPAESFGVYQCRRCQDLSVGAAR